MLVFFARSVCQMKLLNVEIIPRSVLQYEIVRLGEDLCFAHVGVWRSGYEVMKTTWS